MRIQFFNTHSIIFIATALFISGCGKKKDALPSDSFTYTVNNVGEVSIHQGGSATTAYEVRLVSGSQKEVRLQVSGLPSGVSADLSPASGIATYTCTATFTAAEDVATGTYRYRPLPQKLPSL